jgi:hypothetical protein
MWSSCHFCFLFGRSWIQIMALETRHLDRFLWFPQPLQVILGGGRNLFLLVWLFTFILPFSAMGLNWQGVMKQTQVITKRFITVFTKVHDWQFTVSQCNYIKTTFIISPERSVLEWYKYKFTIDFSCLESVDNVGTHNAGSSVTKNNLGK